MEGSRLTGNEDESRRQGRLERRAQPSGTTDGKTHLLKGNARFGLVNCWLMTQHWSDCIDEVAQYYDLQG